MSKKHFKIKFRLTLFLLYEGPLQFPKITKSYFVLLPTCLIFTNLRILPYSVGCQDIFSSHWELGFRLNFCVLKYTPSLGGGKINCKKLKTKILGINIYLVN